MSQTPTTITVDSLPIANSIDPIQDRTLIYTASATDIQGINRNTYLGLSSQPVGINDSQTLTTKVLNNTNTIILKDTSFTLQDDGDTSKQAKFQLSGLTTATTRTYTLPDLSDTLLTLTATQTLTNKTLTSPTISSPTITNATLSADAITGFSTSNTGTIYGIGVSAGVISTANSIAAGTIVQNGVAASQLATTAITLGYVQITTNFTTTSASAVQVTSLTLTVTIPAGGRRIKVSAYTGSLASSSSGVPVLSLWNGIVGSGTQIQQCNGIASDGAGKYIVWSGTPGAGSVTYNLGLSTSAGTGTLTGSSTIPAFLIVEAI